MVVCRCIVWASRAPGLGRNEVRRIRTDIVGHGKSVRTIQGCVPLVFKSIGRETPDYRPPISCTSRICGAKPYRLSPLVPQLNGPDQLIVFPRKSGQKVNLAYSIVW